jgi:predicted peptidase
MKLLYGIIALFMMLTGSAQDFSIYEKHYFNAPELNLPYRLLRPVHREAEKKYPLLIFLHGAFEKGFDNEAQLNIRGRYFMRDSIGEKYPAYVVFPQCPLIDSWAYFETTIDSATGQPSNMTFPFRKKPTEVSAVLMKLIDSLVKADKIDPTRVYIAGLSQGGMGVLDLVARYPQTFAAGLSICGAGDASTAKLFAGKVALWLFHGDKDDIVPVKFSRDYYKKLQKLHADVRYSEYPNVRHNSWVNAFAEPQLLSWLFSKQKK